MVSILQKDFYSHKCVTERKMMLSTKDAKQSDNSLVETKNGFYSLKDKLAPGLWAARRIKTETFNVEGVEVPWDDVGVRSLPDAGYEEEEEEERIVNREIRGKVLIIGSTFVTARREWLLYE